LSKIAKIVSARKDIIVFEDAFVVQKKSTYADEDNLTLLTKKAQVFLLEIFGNIYQRLGQSSIVEGREEKITYKLASLNLVVDKKQMLLGFSSEHLPLFDKCDHCYGLLYDRTGKSSMVIACGHGYHESCFTILNGKCCYCESILKLGIKNNISSLLSRLSKLDKSKSNLEKIVETDEDSPQDQRIENEDDILEVPRKDKQALSRVEQAYPAAFEKFLNTNIANI
ncbi:34068_t:CDS:1, partial [Racocetra persica]